MRHVYFWHFGHHVNCLVQRHYVTHLLHHCSLTWTPLVHLCSQRLQCVATQDLLIIPSIGLFPSSVAILATYRVVASVASVWPLLIIHCGCECRSRASWMLQIECWCTYVTCCQGR